MAASTLPRAFPLLPVRGVLRLHPEDFRVDERADHVADERGEHLLLAIEKRGVNSQHVASELARLFAVPAVDVSYAGMKDRHAVTRQWFSVRTPHSGAGIASGDAWRIFDTRRSQRKLRRGDLTGNSFAIRIRDVAGDRAALTERLEQLRSSGVPNGVPNYFGEQRFGRDGANIERAWAWLGRRPRPAIPPFQKGLHLSTARALLFNAVLAGRVSAGNWQTLLDGDVADGGSPTGPLWGRGRSPTGGCAAHHEKLALAPHAQWFDPLEHLGLVQERRPLVARPLGLEWAFDGTVLELRFELRRGQYATAVLRELGTWCNAALGAAA